MKAKRYGRMRLHLLDHRPARHQPGPRPLFRDPRPASTASSKSAALEFSGYGITVNGVEPGNILTEGMQKHRSAGLHPEHGGRHSARPPGHAARCRQAALFLASDEAAYITGTTIVVDGGQTLPEGKDFRLGPA